MTAVSTVAVITAKPGSGPAVESALRDLAAPPQIIVAEPRNAGDRDKRSY